MSKINSKKIKKCIVCNEKQPIFNFSNLPPKYCKSCSLDGMVDVNSQKCMFEGCKKASSFNYKGEKKRLYCSEHKLEGMIQIHKKMCVYKDCHILPSYNFKNENKPLYCTAHKLPDMIDLLHRKCLEDNCQVSAHFNVKGEKKGLYCDKHKLENMVNVVSKRCEYENCELRPLFNFKDKKKARFCSQHKEDGMIDLRHARCESQDCELSAYFNYESEKKGRFCSRHKLKDMVDVLHDVCLFEGCQTASSFNYKGKKKGLYCAKHCLEDMIDVKRKMCIVCNLTSAWIEKKYCRACFVFLNPDHKSNKNFLFKQKEVVKELEEEFKIDRVDRRVDGGCSRRRPDIVIDQLSHVVIVEIDEDQHKYYNDECEKQRINDLYQDFGFRPIVMIRFNPDKYMKYGEKVLGMFDKQKRKRLTEYNLRILKLKEVLSKNIFNVPETHFTIEYLFYNIENKINLIFND